MYSVMRYIDEVSVPITSLMVNNIEEDRYTISNYGVVFDLKSNREMSQCICGDGYLVVNLRVFDPDNLRFYFKHVLVHRLVGMGFIPGDFSLQINHIDGNKFNNYYKNLEWVTCQQNLLHAVETGLNYRGEDKVNAILSNEIVENICLYLQNGYDYNYIVEKLNLAGIKNIHNIMHDIKCGKSWKFISSRFNIPKYKIVNNRLLSREQVETICMALSMNHNITNSELFRLANIDVSTPEKYNKMRHCIESIKQKKAYNDISDNYNI